MKLYNLVCGSLDQPDVPVLALHVVCGLDSTVLALQTAQADGPGHHATRTLNLLCLVHSEPWGQCTLHMVHRDGLAAQRVD